MANKKILRVGDSSLWFLSAAVGVVFGNISARKTASLAPIEALDMKIYEKTFLLA